MVSSFGIGLALTLILQAGLHTGTYPSSFGQLTCRLLRLPLKNPPFAFSVWLTGSSWRWNPFFGQLALDQRRDDCYKVFGVEVHEAIYRLTKYVGLTHEFGGAKFCLCFDTYSTQKVKAVFQAHASKRSLWRGPVVYLVCFFISAPEWEHGTTGLSIW